MPEDQARFIPERPDALAQQRERYAEAMRGVAFEIDRDDMEAATVWLREALEAAKEIKRLGHQTSAASDVRSVLQAV
jgi:hypothetical protein